MHISVAIDGPSGAGKSTSAKAAAAKLGFIYVDTGAMYRAVGLYFMRLGINAAETAKIGKAVSGAEVTISYDNGTQRVFLCGEDVSEKIREHAVSAAASDFSAVPAVRAHLLELQRGLAASSDVIMDGRDIGTVILPNASVKIFLTASLDKRAERRYKELKERGQCAQLDTVRNDIAQRDYNDTHRKTSPLKQAPGAVLLDSSELDPEQTVDEIVRIIMEKTAQSDS